MEKAEEEGAPADGSKPNTARTNNSNAESTAEDAATEDAAAEKPIADGGDDEFTSSVEVPETPPVLPLPYACEAIREARDKVKKIDEEKAHLRTCEVFEEQQ